MRDFKVGVFNHDGAKKRFYTAYTTWYNPLWSGCCEHKIAAINGTDAKKKAIAEHKAKCEALAAVETTNTNEINQTKAT